MIEGEKLKYSKVKTERNIYLFLDTNSSFKVYIAFNKDKSAFKDLTDNSIHKRMLDGKPTYHYNVEDYVSRKYNIERGNIRFVKLEDFAELERSSKNWCC